MHHDFIDKYSDLDSFIHRLDARIKLIAAFIVLLAIILIPLGETVEVVSYLIILWLLVLVSGVPAYFIFRKTALLSCFALVVAIFLPFFSSGRTLYEIHLIIPIRITYDGALIYSNVLSKAYLAILTMVLLTSTTRFSQILSGLQKLRCPRVFIILLSLAYRYIFILIDETEKTITAREARRFGIRGWENIRSFFQLLSSLFLRTYERADAIYSAMLSRGFDGEIRTFHHSEVSFSQALLLIIFSSIIIAIKIIGSMYYA